MAEPGTASEERRAALAMAVWLVAFWCLALIPFRVVGIGFRPMDDARRHAAKVVSGRAWTEVLVLRPGASEDPHPGWHALLGVAHRAGVRTPTGLVVLSAVGLGVLVLVTPLLVWRGRPEAWLLALLAAALAGWGFFYRALLGRPYVVTLAVLFALAFLWPRLRADRLPPVTWGALLGLFALSAWIHGNWYLWLLPLGCFVLARELRVARRLAAAMASGIAGGAIATGDPLRFLAQTLLHPYWALAGDVPPSLLVTEFQPSGGAGSMLVAFGGFVLWRHLRGRELAPLLSDPIVLLALAGWALGLHTGRFWSDWGFPACLAWMARELDDALGDLRIEGRSRLLLTTVSAAILFLAVTADVRSRWSRSERSAFLSLDDPEHRPWLPEPEGILYSNDMRVFYNTFFKNPHAPWRYILGFEPALMPPGDLAVYREIQREHASDEAFAPWVAKMQPADRLVIVRAGGSKPAIAELEWHSPFRGMWIGRLNRGASEKEGASTVVPDAHDSKDAP